MRWYVYDGLGSVLGEVDPSGNMTSSRKYDVYGLVRGGTNPGGTSAQKFVGALGHTSEDNTGLIYMRARYMDPALGRFTSEDPGMQGDNWYTYCNNDSVNKVDSNGKYWQLIVAVVVLAWIALSVLSNAGYLPPRLANFVNGVNCLIVGGALSAGTIALRLLILAPEYGCIGFVAAVSLVAVAAMIVGLCIYCGVKCLEKAFTAQSDMAAEMVRDDAIDTASLIPSCAKSDRKLIPSPPLPMEYRRQLISSHSTYPGIPLHYTAC